MEIILTHECHECGAEMRKHILITSETFPLMFLSQMTFTCPECGEDHSTGDINIISESEF